MAAKKDKTETPMYKDYLYLTGHPKRALRAISQHAEEAMGKDVGPSHKQLAQDLYSFAQFGLVGEPSPEPKLYAIQYASPNGWRIWDVNNDTRLEAKESIQDAPYYGKVTFRIVKQGGKKYHQAKESDIDLVAHGVIIPLGMESATV